MKCIVCGAALTASIHCPQCGCDVTVQKKVMAMSNLYYNQGLEKAQIRDLSGAITCLERSLKMYKSNIQARNLLGLIYFETGEVVRGLSQWLISQSYQPEDNLASEYIQKLDHNNNRLDTINISIRKYNQCLEYCKNDNRDMAKMQLKKVLAVNPKLIKAYHLLSLIYIFEEDYEKARKQLKLAAKIDKTNTTTLRFLREVEEQTGRVTQMESRFRMKEKDATQKNGSVVIASGNDYIIQPPEYKEKTFTNTLINLVLGLLVGAAVLWFLIVPARTQKINEEANQKIVEYSGKMAAQSAELSRMQEQMSASTESVNTAQSQIAEAGNRSASYENLLKAWQAYQEESYDTAANAMESVDASLLSVEAKSMYDSMMDSLGSTIRRRLENEGRNALANQDYDTAITSLEKAVNLGNPDSSLLFNLGLAYDGKGDDAQANNWYQQVMSQFPGTEDAENAKDYLEANGGSTQSTEGEPATDEGSTPEEEE